MDSHQPPARQNSLHRCAMRKHGDQSLHSEILSLRFLWLNPNQQLSRASVENSQLAAFVVKPNPWQWIGARPFAQCNQAKSWQKHRKHLLLFRLSKNGIADRTMWVANALVLTSWWKNPSRSGAEEDPLVQRTNAVWNHQKFLQGIRTIQWKPVVPERANASPFFPKSSFSRCLGLGSEHRIVQHNAMQLFA